MYIILYLLTKRLVKEVELAIGNFWQPFKSQFSRFKTIFFLDQINFNSIWAPYSKSNEAKFMQLLGNFQKKNYVKIQYLNTSSYKNCKITLLHCPLGFNKYLYPASTVLAAWTFFCNSTLSKPISSGKSLVIVFFPHYMSFLTYHGLCSNFN